MPKRRAGSQPTQLAWSDGVYSGVPHHNQRLFSDYFLNNLLPHDRRWQEYWHQLKAEAIPIKEHLKQLFKSFAPNEMTNEAQTENEWIRPILSTLGHTYEVQAELRVPGGTQRPDYTFYIDDTQRQKNRGYILDDTVAKQGAFAVGDAKRWQRSLDQALKGAQRGQDEASNKNPSFQIFFYMLHSKLPWGILTNGQQWRLYHESTAHKLEIFYEVNLPDLLLAEEVEPFLYFYAFFRRAAFDPGPLALDELLVASSEYSQQISENLRLQVYDALCDIAQGFLDYKRNRLTPGPETCRLLYGSGLVLLYRLLFILYAEARGLLPLQENRQYKRDFSLDAIKKDAAEKLNNGILLDMSGVFWERLKTLFTSIDEGNSPLGVNTFNGGLFAAETNEFHEFLDRYTIGDHAICQAIDKLARVRSQFIDYRDLAERHLGTIYEGLLEYTLHVATEPMVELRSSSKIVPRQDVPQKDIAKMYNPGKVYLVTDRGERKTTGSYYTPDYIVKYMVEQSVGACLDETIQTLGNTARDEEKIQAVLSIKVLDPAMGSGHFPVEVIEFIARYIVKLDVQTEEAEEASLTYWKRRAAQQCIYGVDINPLSVELAKLSLWLATAAKNHPLNFLDHHLRPGNALVGSWLNDISEGFYRKLKHRVVQVEQSQGQKQEEEQEIVQPVPLINMDAFQQDLIGATEKFTEIEHNPGNTVEEVKIQEQAYKEISKAFKEKYLLLAQLRPALYYLGVSDDLWNPLARFAMNNTDGYTPDITRQFQEILDSALKIAHNSKSFFHWELEFPHLFYNRSGKHLGEKAGVDVVISNPPYVRQEQLSEDKPFYEDNYAVFQGTADLFVYFFEQGLQLLRRGGRLVYISSNTWLRTNSATKLRKSLKTQTTIETIIDLGNNRIFADAPDLTPSIQVVRKIQPPLDYRAQAAIFVRGESVKTFRDHLAEKQFPITIYDQPDTGWQLTSIQSRSLLTKLLKTGRTLHTVLEKQRGILLGIKTGLTDAFVIDQRTRDRLIKEHSSCRTLLKPFLRGENLRPWYQENEGHWLICIPSGWTQERFPELKSLQQLAFERLQRCYPGLAQYLQTVENSLLQHVDQGQFWWEWSKEVSIHTNLPPTFIIDHSTRENIFSDGSVYENLIEPFIQEKTSSSSEKRWVIHIPDGWTEQRFPELSSLEILAWEKFQAHFPGLAAYLAPFKQAAQRRQDKGQFWWELRACDYYDVFEQSKIVFPDITKKPRFSWSEAGIYLGNTGYCIPTDSYALLGILASRTIWYLISHISQPLGERAGALIYRLFGQYMERLRIPDLTEEQQARIASLAHALTDAAQKRYENMRNMKYRFHNDLGVPTIKLNQKLTTWWQLDFQEFRAEIEKVFHRDIPIKERRAWEEWLNECRNEIDQQSQQIIQLEEELNREVYAAFGLNKEDISIIEKETKYQYAEW